MTNSEFLTIKQAAAMIGVSPLTLRNWDNSGKFTASRHPINNYRVYKRAEVLMLLDDIRSKQATIKKEKPQERQQIERPVEKQEKKLQIRHLD